MRRWLVLLALSLQVVMVAPAAAGPAGAIRAPAFTAADRADIAAAAARGRSVSLVVASRDGANAAVAARLGALGARIVGRDDGIGYLRATLAADRALAAAVPGVESIAVNRRLVATEPRPSRSQSGDGSAERPGPTTPPVNPWVPTGDIGAPQFVASHPTSDGRGVVVGIVDDGVDLLTPELQVAVAADGSAIDKVVDYVTTTDPEPGPDRDPTWVTMDTEVEAAGQHFTAGDRTYTAPYDGPFRFGVFDERAAGLDAIEFDVNRDGNEAGSVGKFSVLWDEATGTVWVDTDQDLDLAGELAMRDYGFAHDVGEFGSDDPETVVRDTIPFAVQTGPGPFINLLVELGLHGTLVAATATGRNFFGGEADGAAPVAQLAMVRSDLSTGSIVEGVLHLVEAVGVDVLSLSFGDPYPVGLNTTGPTVLSVLLDRVVTRFGVPVFASAGNWGPTVNAVGRPATTARVFAMGGSAARATMLRLVGLDLERPEEIVYFSARGPSEDGALKPELVAPAVSIVAVPQWLRPQPTISGVDLGVGYQDAYGTSIAAPLGAGTTALLLSAALEAGIPVAPATLRTALLSTARVIVGEGVEEQGMGVVSVGDAWDVLLHHPAEVRFDTAAPVNTKLAGMFSTPFVGPGLYEREGWAPGETGTRRVVLTRLTGTPDPVSFDLSWLGNDGTFSAPPSVEIARDTPTDVPVDIAPVGPGLHAAVLRVDDPTTAGIDHVVAVTIAVADQLTQGNGYMVSRDGTVFNDDVVHHFVAVPPVGPASLRVEVKHVQQSQMVAVSLIDPDGVIAFFPVYVGHNGKVLELPDPPPGVWEVAVNSIGPGYAPYMVTTSLVLP